VGVYGPGAISSLPVSLNSYFVVAASVVWHLKRQYDLDKAEEISRVSWLG